MGRVFEIEVNGRLNESLSFHPFRLVVRGRWEMARMAVTEPHAGQVAEKLGGITEIPGQIIGFDLDKAEAYLREPLWEPEHQAVRAKIEATKKTIPDKYTPFVNVTLDTCAYWMERAVVGRNATVFAGQLPTYDAAKARLRWLQPTRAADPAIDRLTKQNALMMELIFTLLPEARREQAQKMMEQFSKLGDAPTAGAA